MKNSQVTALLLLGAGLFLLSRKANANTIADDDFWIEYIDDAWNQQPGVIDDPYNPSFPTMPEVVDIDTNDYLRAFLWMIGAAETSPQAMNSGLAYNTFYGGGTFTDLRDHPAITGERKGVPLPDELCRKAGFSPGCVSTAAGAFQINRPTWDQVRAAGIWGARLPDFSIESQWEAARRVLILAGGLDFAKAGQFDLALQYAGKRWASLPASTSGQRKLSRAQVYAYYTDALGLA